MRNNGTSTGYHNFDYENVGTRFQKYTYYVEYIMVRLFVCCLLLGVLVIFWEGWTKGSVQYMEAKKTVDICHHSREVMINSDHLRHTCMNAESMLSTYPVLYATKFTLKTILDWIVEVICQIGSSWLTSSIMGLVFTILIAYVYRRATGPPNPYSVVCSHNASFERAFALANQMYINDSGPGGYASSYPMLQDVSDYNAPIDYTLLKTKTKSH